MSTVLKIKRYKSLRFGIFVFNLLVQFLSLHLPVFVFFIFLFCITINNLILMVQWKLNVSFAHIQNSIEIHKIVNLCVFFLGRHIHCYSQNWSNNYIFFNVLDLLFAIYNECDCVYFLFLHFIVLFSSLHFAWYIYRQNIHYKCLNYWHYLGFFYFICFLFYRIHTFSSLRQIQPIIFTIRFIVCCFPSNSRHIMLLYSKTIWFARKPWTREDI